MMALTKHPVGVIVFSWTAGVMYSTLFTMPYLLVAHYHASSTVSNIRNQPFLIVNSLRSLYTNETVIPLQMQEDSFWNSRKIIGRNHRQ